MGKEARLKRERAAADKAGLNKEYIVHVTQQELWGLFQHMNSGASVSDGHDEQIALSAAFLDLGVSELQQLSLAGVPISSKDYPPTEIEIVNLNRPTIDALLKFTSGKMHSAVALVLASFVQRLKDAKKDEYSMPSEYRALAAREGFSLVPSEPSDGDTDAEDADEDLDEKAG